MILLSTCEILLFFTHTYTQVVPIRHIILTEYNFFDCCSSDIFPFKLLIDELIELNVFFVETNGKTKKSH